MKVIIPTKNRQGIMSTHRCPAFAGTDLYVLVHTDEQRSAYLQAHSELDPAQVVVTNTAPDTFGLTRQREWACKNLLALHEWFVFADDNINDLTGPAPEERKYRELPTQNGDPTWRSMFSRCIDADDFRLVFAQDVKKAEELGTTLVGFATTGNHFFRGKKWRPVGYVIGKMMLWRNQPYQWDHTISMEDFAHTGEVLLRQGSVLIDNFVYPECTHYQPGGMGTYRERVPQRQADVQALMAKYPGLFRVKQRKDFEPDTDLAVRFTSSKQVDEWRRGMLRG